MTANTKLGLIAPWRTLPASENLHSSQFADIPLTINIERGQTECLSYGLSPRTVPIHRRWQRRPRSKLNRPDLACLRAEALVEEDAEFAVELLVVAAAQWNCITHSQS